jgi:hypothetical protein
VGWLLATRSISTELGRSKRGARIGQVNPELSSDIIKLADALSTWLDTLDHWEPLYLVHSDCKPAQFLVSTASCPSRF